MLCYKRDCGGSGGAVEQFFLFRVVALTLPLFSQHFTILLLAATNVVEDIGEVDVNSPSSSME